MIKRSVQPQMSLKELVGHNGLAVQAAISLPVMAGLDPAIHG